MNQASKRMRVLVVDDDEVTAAVLEHSLIEFGYDVTVARNGREAFELLRSGEIRMIVSDWCMPEMTGLELCHRIRQRRSGTYVYIIMLTSNSSTKDVVEGLNAGADDYITKPFQPEELQVRLRVGERVLSLESRDLTIFALAKLAESRDPDTGAHLERIREYCRVMAEELVHSHSTTEDIDDDFVHMIYLTSPLHDIGKVGIPDHVLLKPGPLTYDEAETMKRHTEIGGQTLDTLASTHPEARFLLIARHCLVASRTLRRRRLPARLVRQEYPAVRPHRRGGRCVRRAHLEACVQGGLQPQHGSHRDLRRPRHAFRSGRSGCLPAARTGLCAPEGRPGRTARFGLADELSPPTLPSRARARARNRLSLLVTRFPFLPVLVLVLVIASRCSFLLVTRLPSPHSHHPPSFPCSCSCS